MPFQRPTLTDLRQSAASDVLANLPGGDGLLRFSNLQVTCDVTAGFANLQYGYLDWIARNSVPWSATDEFLDGWASLKNIFRNGAEPASGPVTFLGTNGLVIPTGTSVVRSDGETFITTADGTIVSGSVIVPVIDTTPGAQGNTAAGSIITIANAIPGINSAGTAAASFTGGANVEDNSLLQNRMLLAYQNPPQGGALADYENWALEVPGVTRVWPMANWMGNGTVGILFMMDSTESAHNGFPQGTNGGATDETRTAPATGDQLAVADHIFGSLTVAKQPVTALVYAVAPTPQAVNFTIHGLVPNTVAMQQAISAALVSCFLRNGVAGNATGTTIFPHAAIEASLVTIPGIEDFVIVVPAGDIAISPGALPVLGSITYT